MILSKSGPPSNDDLGGRRPRALLLVGHGSHLNPDSSAPVYAHAARIRALGLFDEVVEAFWKEEPSLRDAIDLIESTEIFIVPLFLAEGYFTRQVLPRELGLTPPITRSGGRTIHYCAPVGTHPSMTDLVLERARAMPGLTPSDRAASALVIIGHGTNRSPTSGDTVYRLVDEIRATGEFESVECGFLDEAPVIGDVLARVTASRVALVPFFLAEGWHTAETIPEDIGLVGSVTRMGERDVWYAPPIGTMPAMSRVIVDLAAVAGAFDQGAGEADASALARFEGNGTALEEAATIAVQAPISAAVAEFVEWLDVQRQAIRFFMQVAIQSNGDQGYRITHIEDVGQPDSHLRAASTPEELNGIARFAGNGDYRPLRSRGDLRGGWVAQAADARAVANVVSAIYPAAILHWYRGRTRALDVVPFSDWAARQTGIYQVVRKMTPGDVANAIDACCRVCLRSRCWPAPAEALALSDDASIPHVADVPCPEPCTLFATVARDQSSRRSDSH